MKKLPAILLFLFVLFFSVSAYAVPTTLIEQGDNWNYAVLSTELYGIWNSIDYNTIGWDAISWANADAPFGNNSSWYDSASGQYYGYGTYWGANTDLALQTSYYLDGSLADLTLHAASDNGFIVFVNGVQVAKRMAEGWTSYWEYSIDIDSAAFTQGENVISVFSRRPWRRDMVRYGTDWRCKPGPGTHHPASFRFRPDRPGRCPAQIAKVTDHK